MLDPVRRVACAERLLNVGDPEAMVVVGAVLVISAVLTAAVVRGRSRSQELAVPLLG